MNKILIIEDDKVWIDILSKELKEKVTNCIIENILFTSQDYNYFLQSIEKIKPDLVIFDVNMGGDAKAGVKLAKYIKKKIPDLGFVFLTSQKKEDPLIISNAAEVGAITLFDKSDFINDLESLSNFISNSLNKNINNTKVISLPPLEINYQDRTVKLNNTNIQFTKMEFEILFHLAKHKNQVFSKFQLYDHATTEHVVEDTFENTIVSHIKAIRDKLMKIDSDFKPILTVPSYGYKYYFDN